MAPDGAGGWYVGGVFDTAGSLPRRNLAHVLADGSVDPGWAPAVSGDVNALAVSAGTVYVGGTFKTVSGQSRRNLAAVDAGTGAVTSWTPTVAGDANRDGAVLTIAVAGSTVYAGGFFATVGGVPRPGVAAISAVTAQVTPWDPQLDLFGVYSLALSGSLVVIGAVYTDVAIGPVVTALDRTSAAARWQTEANGSIQVVTVVGSAVVAGGSFNLIGNQDLNGGVIDLARSGATMFVVGGFTEFGGLPREYLAEFDVATGRPTAFEPFAGPDIPPYNAVAVSADQVYVGGYFFRVGNRGRANLAAFDRSTGQLTSSDLEVETLSFANGVVYAGGQFTAIGGRQRSRIAALDPVTGAATSWNPDAEDTVETILVSRGTVFLGGEFDSVGGQPRGGLAAVDAVSGAVSELRVDAGRGFVLSLAERGGTLYVGGDFFTLGGQQPRHAGAVDLDTGTVTPWDRGTGGDAGVTAGIRSIVTTVQGPVFLAGGFLDIGPGSGHSFVAQVSPSGG